MPSGLGAPVHFQYHLGHETKALPVLCPSITLRIADFVPTILFGSRDFRRFRRYNAFVQRLSNSARLCGRARRNDLLRNHRSRPTVDDRSRRSGSIARLLPALSAAVGTAEPVDL